ncbi:MAG: hypothetical protein R3C42_03125 [Parvularculaceae bacterium]|nr:hypothetical protein [Parvularculaceae bacterium]
MRAKVSYFLIALLASAGCANGLKRIAPPGIVKYEDRAKGEPVSPEIEARIETHNRERAGGFPTLGEQPGRAPDGIAAPERAAMEASLLQARDELNEAISNDRRLADAERLESLEESRDALGSAVLKDDAAARRERGLPARRAPDAPQNADER